MRTQFILIVISMSIFGLTVMGQDLKKASDAGEALKFTKLPGKVKGAITAQIKFPLTPWDGKAKSIKCGDLAVTIAPTVNPKPWNRQVKAFGNISTGKCAFEVANVPAGEGWTLTTRLLPTTTCQYQPGASPFPASVKPGQTLVYNIDIPSIDCVDPITWNLKGTIRVNVGNMGGNNLGNFGCSNISIRYYGTGKPNPMVAATGNIASGKCTYSAPNLPAKPTSAAIGATFPKTCDQRVFTHGPPQPSGVSLWGMPVSNFGFDFDVYAIRCDVAK